MICTHCGETITKGAIICPLCNGSIKLGEIPSDPFESGQPTGDPFSFSPQAQDMYQGSTPAAQAHDERAAKTLNNALMNGVVAVAFSIWTLSVVFTAMFDNVWMFIFIAVDFVSSIPAIVGAVRGRSASKTKFLAALIMGIASTIASMIALIYWAVNI